MMVSILGVASVEQPDSSLRSIQPVSLMRSKNMISLILRFDDLPLPRQAVFVCYSFPIAKKKEFGALRRNNKSFRSGALVH